MLFPSIASLLSLAIVSALSVAPAESTPPKMDARPAVELLLRDSQALEIVTVESGSPQAMQLVLPLEWRSLSNTNAATTTAGYKIPYTARVRCIATKISRSGQEQPIIGRLCEPAGKDSLVAPFVWIPDAPLPYHLPQRTLTNSAKRPIKTGQVVTVKGYVYAYRRKNNSGQAIVVSYPYADLGGLVTLPQLP